MFDRLSKYYHTLKYLKGKQIIYRIRYLFYKPALETKNNDLDHEREENSVLKLIRSISSYPSFLKKDHIQFLNLDHFFEKEIDWNFFGNGKLWTYNLNYFEFLLQPNFSKEKGLYLINHFIDNEFSIKDGMEAYPISLRLIFWIKFLIKYQIEDPKIRNSIQRQTRLLTKKMEYHLMGNHLLENGFSLLFSAFYSGDIRLFQKAEAIMVSELKEQILADGGHFELSPMYHQTILFRMLDSINLLKHNELFDQSALLNLLTEKARKMLGWMNEIQFSNGDFPQLNDSTRGVAPTADKLADYANRLFIKADIVSLGESGYRKFVKSNYELIVDVGNIGPDYIPGHAHSDTFNFVLYHQANPLIVDTGISTYEKNDKRQTERSTSAHNTVEISGKNQSDVWGGFRVAKRAKVINLNESSNQITATHDGYKDLNCNHNRMFTILKNEILIQDKITGNQLGKAYLHFHPTVKVIQDNQYIRGDFGHILFDDQAQIRLTDYQHAAGFNQTSTAIRAIIEFKQALQTKLVLI
jgi:Uncharacterized protein conserved in bacteria